MSIDSDILTGYHHFPEPSGAMLYIQSGDTTDFDGYMIAAAAQQVCANNPRMECAIILPERRACPDISEINMMTHDPIYGEEVVETSAKLLRLLCPSSMIVKGPLNSRNVIPHKFAFNEVKGYGPLIEAYDVEHGLQDMDDLAKRIKDPEITAIIIDVNGSVGYLVELKKLFGDEIIQVLGEKMKASGKPIVFMAGILAEIEPMTLSLPGRDARSTMNAIYSPEGVRIILDIAKKHDIELLFVSNNVCNKLLRFNDAQDVKTSMGLDGLLAQISDEWYDRPHLRGKCVPFDWVSFCAMLMFGKTDVNGAVVQTEERDLMVGMGDASVLVLAGLEPLASNMIGTERWGAVKSVIHIDANMMMRLSSVISKIYLC